VLFVEANVKLKLIAIALLAVAAVGCKENPISGRKQLMLVSEEQAQASSAQAYSQTVDKAQKAGKLSTDAALNARVKRITDRLIAEAKLMYPPSRDWKWSVVVLDEPKLNAWCMPGGKMAIYTGIVRKLALTDDEIAQIMGHEIAHAILGHGRERMSRALATQGGVLVGSIVAGYDLTGLTPIADIALTLPNSRTGESEADRWGVELAARAGYDPHAAVRLWQKMSQASGNGLPEFLSTHPSPDNRIEALNALVPKMMPIYEKARR
jgi:predicted Zn-dependent protease